MPGMRVTCLNKASSYTSIFRPWVHGKQPPPSIYAVIINRSYTYCFINLLPPLKNSQGMSVLPSQYWAKTWTAHEPVMLLKTVSINRKMNLICCSENNSQHNEAGRQHSTSYLVCQRWGILHGIKLISSHMCKDRDRKVANNLWTVLFTSRTYIKYLKHQLTFLMRRHREVKDVTSSTFIAEVQGNLVHVCSVIFYCFTQQEEGNIHLLMREIGSESMLQKQNAHGLTRAAN